MRRRCRSWRTEVSNAVRAAGGASQPAVEESSLPWRTHGVNYMLTGTSCTSMVAPWVCKWRADKHHEGPEWGGDAETGERKSVTPWGRQVGPHSRQLRRAACLGEHMGTPTCWLGLHVHQWWLHGCVSGGRTSTMRALNEEAMPKLENGSQYRREGGRWGLTAGSWGEQIAMENTRQWDFTYINGGFIVGGETGTFRALAPVPLTVFRSNSKFDPNLECSSLKCAQPITTKFCSRHDSYTVVTCAKFRRDW